MASFKLASLYVLNDTNGEERNYAGSEVFDENNKQRSKEYYKEKSDPFLQYLTIEAQLNAESKLPELKISVDEKGPFQYVEYKVDQTNNPNEYALQILLADRKDPQYYNFSELKSITVEDTTPEKLVGIINKLQETVNVLCNRVVSLEDYIDNNMDNGPIDDGGEDDVDDESCEYSTWSPSNSSSSPSSNAHSNPPANPSHVYRPPQQQQQQQHQQQQQQRNTSYQPNSQQNVQQNNPQNFVFRPNQQQQNNQQNNQPAFPSFSNPPPGLSFSNPTPGPNPFALFSSTPSPNQNTYYPKK